MKIESIRNYYPTISYKSMNRNNSTSEGQLGINKSVTNPETLACVPDKNMYSTNIPSEMIKSGVFTEEYTNDVESKINLLV